MSFSSEVKAFSEKVNKRTLIVFQKIVFDVLSRIVKLTPVQEGRLKNNWQVTMMTPSRSILKGFDKTGIKAIGRAAKATDKITIGKRVFIVNNLPYAQAIEDGHSDQAPTGMVKITIAQFMPIFNKALKEARQIK